jgi:hypothetical protein
VYAPLRAAPERTVQPALAAQEYITSLYPRDSWLSAHHGRCVSAAGRSRLIADPDSRGSGWRLRSLRSLLCWESPARPPPGRRAVPQRGVLCTSSPACVSSFMADPSVCRRRGWSRTIHVYTDCTQPSANDLACPATRHSQLGCFAGNSAVTSTWPRL